MVGSVERIAQELTALDQKVVTIAQELHGAYADYLSALGQAVRQQLILASYHVCTQGYPEAFLSLSYSPRQTLQKNLRYLSRQVQEELLAQLHIPVPIEATVPEEMGLDELQNLMQPAPTAPPVATDAPARSLTPDDLLQWQRDLEQAIDHELQTASHAANHLLQQAGVLSKKLPPGLIEAATKAAEMSESGSSTPNVLSLRLDAMERGSSESEEDNPKPHAILHVVAIHLRLSEIEFTDTPTTALRTRLRNLSAQLKTLAREYAKKQRERAIAEAQAAWRSSWSEE